MNSHVLILFVGERLYLWYWKYEKHRRKKPLKSQADVHPSPGCATWTDSKQLCPRFFHRCPLSLPPSSASIVTVSHILQSSSLRIECSFAVIPPLSNELEQAAGGIIPNYWETVKKKRWETETHHPVSLATRELGFITTHSGIWQIGLPCHMPSH